MSNAEARQQIGVLYSEHHSWLATWLGHKLNCKNLAADLAQDTFLRLLGSRLPADLLEPRAYLTTIAKGLLNNYLRRKKLEEAYLAALEELPEPTQPSPEEQLLVLEALAEIDRILDNLPPKAKQVFLLAQLDGLTYQEICTLLNISLSTVKRHMVLAFQRCLAAL